MDPCKTERSRESNSLPHFSMDFAFAKAQD